MPQNLEQSKQPKLARQVGKGTSKGTHQFLASALPELDTSSDIAIKDYLHHRGQAHSRSHGSKAETSQDRRRRNRKVPARTSGCRETIKGLKKAKQHLLNKPQRDEILHPKPFEVLDQLHLQSLGQQPSKICTFVRSLSILRIFCTHKAHACKYLWALASRQKVRLAMAASWIAECSLPRRIDSGASPCKISSLHRIMLFEKLVCSFLGLKIMYAAGHDP